MGDGSNQQTRAAKEKAQTWAQKTARKKEVSDIITKHQENRASIPAGRWAEKVGVAPCRAEHS